MAIGHCYYNISVNGNKNNNDNDNGHYGEFSNSLGYRSLRLNDMIGWKIEQTESPPNI